VKTTANTKESVRQDHRAMVMYSRFDSDEPMQRDTLAERSPLVLCVEDDLRILLLVSTVLESAGFCVVGCDDSRQALQICSKTMPDLALVDYDMPNMNGGALDRALKQCNRVLPIVPFSGNPSLPPEALVFVDGYVRKGLDVGQILEMLRAVASSGPH